MTSVDRLRHLTCAGVVLMLSFWCPLGMRAQESSLVVKPLFSFACDSSTNVCPDGNGPNSLLQSADGNFYGTTSTGGLGNKPAGTIFKITPSGQLTTLYTFVADESGNYLNGSNPSSLVEGNDGFLYGSASGGLNNGVVFKASRTGKLQVVSNAVGPSPYGLLLGRDGSLYGCTQGLTGTLFRVTPAGSYTLLHTFNRSVDGPACIGMILASDGNVYGTTLGGETVLTTLFRVTPDAKYSIVHTFHYFQFPTSAPTESSNGELNGALSRFEDVAETGMFSIGFSGAGYVEFPFTYGFQPPDVSYMSEASDGNFWGIRGDAIVSFAHNGAPLQQASFVSGNSSPVLLLQASDGRLFGVASTGSFDLDPGAIFVGTARLAPPKPLFVSPNPSSGAAGSKVMIQGAHFVGTTHVAFNGVSAAFKVLNSGNILATVPVGAATGRVAVSNAGGTAESAGNFTIQ